jgi:CheY-like chemotaxis protein
MDGWLLVVDDDDDVRDSLVDALRLNGFRTEGVANGQLALDRLRDAESLPSLLVLDLEMPTMDGWQLIGELKKDARLSAISYVIFSGCDCLDDLGAMAQVNKAESVFELVRVVARCTRPPREARSSRF